MHECVCLEFTFGQRPGSLGNDISISPSGEQVTPLPDGDINLFEQASKIFGQLRAENVFTATTNTFQDLCVRRLHITSDGSQKTNVSVLVGKDATDLVRRLTPRRYIVDGYPAAKHAALQCDGNAGCPWHDGR